KGRPEPSALVTFEPAARYHLIHALAAGFAADRSQRLASGAAGSASWTFLVGVGLFSGSLYALALGAPGAIGFITPLGGLVLIAGGGPHAPGFPPRCGGPLGPKVRPHPRIGLFLS